MGGKGSGRKPKPTAVKERNGSFIKNPNRRNELEPQPTKSRPKLPSSLHGDKVAQRAWHKTCDLLEDMGILTIADMFLVELFALTHSKFMAAHKIWTKEGFIIEGKRHPIATDYHKLADRSEKLLAKLGLEPTERASLRADIEKDEADPLLMFLEQNRRN